MGRHQEFYQEVHRRAVKDARRVLHLDEGTSVLIVVILYGIYALLVWHFIGPTEATTEIENRILASVAPLLLAGLVYVQRRRSAASEMYAETQDKADAREEALENEKKELAEKLLAIGQDRPLTFKNINLSVTKITATDLLVKRISVIYENLSERMLSYSFLALDIELGGSKFSLLSDDSPATDFIHRNQEQSYGGDISPPLLLPELPFDVIVEYTLEFDNVPKTNRRETYLRVKTTFESFEPLVWKSLKLTHQER
jgi:hypothetical protein